MIKLLAVAALFVSNFLPAFTAGEEPDPQPLTQVLPQILTKARGLHGKISRAAESGTAHEILAKESVQIRDWLNEQRWSFTTSVISVYEESDRWFLKLDIPTELARYTRNDAAYLSGGLFSHQLRLPLEPTQANFLKTGDAIQISGKIVAMFGNDAPVRKLEHGSNVLLDLMIPAVNKQSPIRIELAMEEIAINGDVSIVDLPKSAPSLTGAKTTEKPPIESALALIQSTVDNCVSEARRQKNTALISELLVTNRQKLLETINGQRWTFNVKSVDVRFTGDGEYILDTLCHPSLAKYLGNQAAMRRGGIWAFPLRITIDKELAESIGRGDTLSLTGDVQAISGNQEKTGMKILFYVFLPPLDGQQPTQLAFCIENLLVSK